MNKHVKQAGPKETMRFGEALHCLWDFIIKADLDLGLNCLSKVDLLYTYMRICVCLTYIPSVAFLVSREM